jgi:hypothetical protein
MVKLCLVYPDEEPHCVKEDDPPHRYHFAEPAGPVGCGLEILFGEIDRRFDADAIEIGRQLFVRPGTPVVQQFG